MNSRPLPTRLSHVPSQSQAVTLFFSREVELSRREKLFPALFWYLNPVSKTKLLGFPFLRHKRIHQNPELAKRWMDICDGNVTTAHGSAQHCLQWHPAITHAQNFFHNQAKAPISRCTIFLRRGSSTFPRSYFFPFPLFCASFELWGAATSRSTFHLNFACTAVLFIFFLFFFCQTNFHTQRTSFIREEISILASKFSFTAHFDCTPRAPHTITRANCEREQLNTETLHTGF